MHVGEPAFGPPPEATRALVDAVRAGRTAYTCAEGALWLREALTAKLARINAIDTTPDRVFATPGSCQGLAALMQSMAEPGAELLLPALHWPIYLQQCLLAGFRPVFYPLGGDHLPDLDGIESVATPATRAILLNSPANPTGAVLDRGRMSDLLHLARTRGWRLISDEAYEQFVYVGDHVSFAALERDQRPEDRVVDSVFTFSKGAAMTGMRLGYVVTANDRAARALRVVQEASIVAPSTPIQHAGLAALQRWDAGQDNAELVRRNRDGVLPLLVGSGLLGALPHGGWYAVLDVSRTGLDAEAFAGELLSDHGVAVAPATGFALQPRLDDAGRVLEAPAAPWSRHLVRIAFCGDPVALRAGVERLVAFAAARSGGA
ncbi:pyridoxal phosphate-dependent aminotransferase [Krasilnikovia sp. MM14-A1004]